ncbi:hypothetical protein [Oleiharenicola lentus]|uniref:hypothetical protein n=1 Tax=Oleiharenicola lentus TaxID=2508720 RepID=UPI003F6624DE
MNLPRVVAVRAAVVMTGLLILFTGCNSRAQASNAKLRRPLPPVQGVTSVHNERAVWNRSRELIDSGKYATSADALRAARQELGTSSDSEIIPINSGADYTRYREQAEAQEKFEADLAKLKRGT